MVGNTGSIAPKKVTLSFEQLQITPDDFSAFTGHSYEMNEMIISDLEEVIAVGNCVVNIECLYQVFDQISINKKDFTIQETTFNCERKIALQLRESESLIVFVCTSGVGISKQYKEFMLNNELVKAYFVDLLGNVAVEKAMDIIQLQISEKMSLQQLKITNRYSPGYCGWNITEQAKLFSLLPENPCGIVLSESSLMVPSKSISGVIGCGKNVKHKEYGCQLCGLEKCIYRKSKTLKSQT